MKMKRSVKLIGLLLIVAMIVSIASVLVACDEPNKTPEVKEYTVTFYDGNDILRTQTVKEGEKVASWTPTKEGYAFVNWFATPNFMHLFDFDSAITEDKSVFAQWSSASQSVDTREFYIVGSGTSPILMASNWGKVFDDTTRMTKASDKNEYTYTVDLQEDDLFQFAINESWHHQRGAGYLTTDKLEDGTIAFSGASTIGDSSAYRLNIKCEYSGNYTFTLTTHPDDDTYEKGYDDTNKENFNINPLDTISWVRNGDASKVEDVVTTYYIKGASITNWKDVYNASTKLEVVDDFPTLEIYLKEGDEFLFTSLNTMGSDVSVGTEYIRGTNLDNDSKAFLDVKTSGNMVAKASGTYTFTYKPNTKILMVKFDAEKAPVATDYYIDGTFADGVADWSGYCFNDAFKLVETAEGSGIYELKNVSMKADSQIIVQAFKKGATERGEWGTDGYNGLGSYNYSYLVGGGDAFSAVGGGNNNIKVLVEGVYNVTFDSYSKIITFEAVGVENDAYIVGAMTGEGWGLADEWKMTLADGVYSITKDFQVGDEFGVKIMNGSSTEQKYWVGAKNVANAVEAFDVSGNNIKCTVAGTYTVVCTVVDGVGSITITAVAE